MTPDAPSRAQRMAEALLAIALVLVLAWQLAYWTWRFVAPPAKSEAAASGGDVDLAAIARLFGAAAPAGTTAASTSGLRLKGVIAPTPGVAASAIFSTGSGKDIAVFLGSEVQPGVKLAEVHPDHVMLSRNGVSERLDLEVLRASARLAAPGAQTRGFHLNVARSGANSFSLSRKELDDALRDPNQLNYLGQIGVPPGGGVRMEAAPAGSLASKLGLQPGDVIRKVNGQSVASPGDLARLYQQFATISLVQAEVQRGSQTLQLNYQIQ
ncbi:MAG TPA: type II secretion system protein N [Usitatibacter sp.]|nr:type II secretion system protein N [Usitatibacter sp.]